MSGGGSGDKTEKATPRRIKQAKREGQIGNTPEVGAWTGLLVASFLLPHAAEQLLGNSTVTLVRVGAVIRDPDPARATATAAAAFRSAFGAVLPLALVVAAIAVASVALQGGLHPAPSRLVPKLSRLNPLSGLKHMFGPHGVWQLCTALVKTTALGVVVYVSVRGLIPTIIGSGSLQLEQLVHVCVATVLNLLRYAAVGGIAMAGADWFVVRRRNNKSLKMSRQEIKDEFKSTEGDPHVRGMRRSRQLAMRRNRMMADVATADVVVVNPTHVAVALRYEAAKGAPRVVAKGGDHLAATIRALADTNRVPMVADVPLARTLFTSCEVGQEIPPELYKAVATVLAFIMTLKRRGSVAGTHTVRTVLPTR